MSTEQGKLSYENKEAIEASTFCGCYYCLKVYESKEVTEYCKDKNGYTAICPHCGIDSVVPYDPVKYDLSGGVFENKLREWYKASFT